MNIRVAIACGGTGGHLFPGLAVGSQLAERGCKVTLLVSPKDVDQQAVKSAAGLEVVTLPAVGLTRGRRLAFVRGFWQSYRASARLFKAGPPHAVLAMGGFTSAPPILAGRRAGAKTFLHESNTIPGRANRWLSRVVDQAFIGFPSAAGRLHARTVTVSGTPVRPQFRPCDPAVCRAELGFDPARPLILVMGGSQGAAGINRLVAGALPLLAKEAPQWQWLHLSGPEDAPSLRTVYAENGIAAQVHSFLARMDLALGAATAAVSRAGASSLAEIAALRLPSVLIPYPAATDDHQLHNARAFVETGAARLLAQRGATPRELADLLLELAGNAEAARKMRLALAQWHSPRAAQDIAENMLRSLGAGETDASSLKPALQTKGVA